MSLGENNSLSGDKPQNFEEDEDLEEQHRHQQELADILAMGFNNYYEDSAHNSSVTSIDGVENSYQDVDGNLKYDSVKSLNNLSSQFANAISDGYKNADPQEQLRILYDVRVREIHSLREEFDKFKEDKANEIKVFKNKLTLAEAEIRHLQITLSNSESLLVEKNEMMKELKQNVANREEDIKNLKKIIEEQNLEISTYKSTVSELHLKLADNNPFNSGSRKMKSEELQKIHQEQIIKLETLYQEQSKKVQILEKEKLRLEDDVRKVVQSKNEMEEENNLTIMGLSKKLQSAQQQCKDLFLLGEAIKKESDHLRERVQQYETSKLDISGGSFQSKNMDKDTLLVHLEKLKRMLLDKDIELNTLKAKLKFYNSDLHELFQYRELLNKMYSSEVKSCNNREHEELIFFMQGQLQSLQQAVEDRNNQIMNLNMVNKELQEKIEEMIQQTRTDIQNISQKYSLPQLENMSKELKNAEETINNLKQQLLEKDNEEVVKKLEKVLRENEDLQKLVVREKKKLDEILLEKKKLAAEIEEFKKTEAELIEENDKVKTQLQKICLKLGLSEAEIFESDGDVREFSSLQTKYGKIHEQLQLVFAHLENMNIKRANFNLIFKLKKEIQNYLNSLSEHADKKQSDEKIEHWDNLLTDFIESLRHSNTNLEMNDGVEELTTAKTMLEGEKIALECQLKSKTLELEEARKEIADLNENNILLMKEADTNVCTVQKLNDKVHNLEKCLQIVEDNKSEVEKQLEITQRLLNDAKQEIIDLHKELKQVNDNLVRKNLFKELKDVENVLEQSSDDSNDVFQKCLQAQVLKVEIALRDRLQEESVQKMQKIEEQYKNVITEKTQMHNKEKEKWKRQEANHRKQFAAVLEECGRKMENLEKENVNLTRRMNVMVQEYKTFRNNAVERCEKLVQECKKATEDLSKQWTALLEFYMFNAHKLDRQRHRSAKNVLKRISLRQTELNLIENLYDEKIRKFKAEKEKKTGMK